MKNLLNRSQLKKDSIELFTLLVQIAIFTMPSIIGYYFCRDYRGKGNGPENAPFAAFIIAFMWAPLYIVVKDLFDKHRSKLDIGLLIIFTFLLLLVTAGNPNF